MRRRKIDDIAQAAGVSSSTVSRVFNGRPYVKDEVRRRILRIAAELGYAPNVTARRPVISILVGDYAMESSYSASLLTGLYRTAAEHGFVVEMVRLPEIERVYQNLSKAVIALIYCERDAEIVRSIRHIPVLTVNYITDHCSYVCTDHAGGIEQAVDHLAAHGHERIGLLLAPGEDDMPWGEAARRDGYCRALAAHGIAVRRELISYGPAPVAERLGRLLLAGRPTALIVCGESLTMPVRYALALLKCRIPEDLSVVEFYTANITPYLLPAPSCVRQDFPGIAAAVLRELETLLKNPAGRSEVMLPNDFIVGDSVRDRSDETITEG